MNNHNNDNADECKLRKERQPHALNSKDGEATKDIITLIITPVIMTYKSGERRSNNNNNNNANNGDF